MNKRIRKTQYQKFTVPPDPLEREEMTNNMSAKKATNRFRRQRAIQFYQKLIKDILNGETQLEYISGPIATDPRFRESILNAFSVKLNELLNGEIDSKIDNLFVEEFHRWLLGKSKWNTIHEKTPWGTRMLVGESIIAYIREFIAKKKDFERKLVQLKITGPPMNIKHAWLYFKYIVTEQQPDGNEFLPEWNWWTNPDVQREVPQSLVVIRDEEEYPIQRTGPPNAGAPGPGLDPKSPDAVLQIDSNLPDSTTRGPSSIVPSESPEQFVDDWIPLDGGPPYPGYRAFNDEELNNQNEEPFVDPQFEALIKKEQDPDIKSEEESAVERDPDSEREDREAEQLAESFENLNSNPSSTSSDAVRSANLINENVKNQWAEHKSHAKKNGNKSDKELEEVNTANHQTAKNLISSSTSIPAKVVAARERIKEVSGMVKDLQANLLEDIAKFNRYLEIPVTKDGNPMSPGEIKTMDELTAYANAMNGLLGKHVVAMKMLNSQIPLLHEQKEDLAWANRLNEDLAKNQAKLSSKLSEIHKTQELWNRHLRSELQSGKSRNESTDKQSKDYAKRIIRLEKEKKGDEKTIRELGIEATKKSTESERIQKALRSENQNQQNDFDRKLGELARVSLNRTRLMTDTNSKIKELVQAEGITNRRIQEVEKELGEISKKIQDSNPLSDPEYQERMNTFHSLKKEFMQLSKTQKTRSETIQELRKIGAKHAEEESVHSRNISNANKRVTQSVPGKGGDPFLNRNTRERATEVKNKFAQAQESLENGAIEAQKAIVVSRGPQLPDPEVLGSILNQNQGGFIKSLVSGAKELSSVSRQAARLTGSIIGSGASAAGQAGISGVRGALNVGELGLMATQSLLGPGFTIASSLGNLLYASAKRGIGEFGNAAERLAQGASQRMEEAAQTQRHEHFASGMEHRRAMGEGERKGRERLAEQHEEFLGDWSHEQRRREGEGEGVQIEEIYDLPNIIPGPTQANLGHRSLLAIEGIPISNENPPPQPHPNKKYTTVNLPISNENPRPESTPDPPLLNFPDPKPYIPGRQMSLYAPIQPLPSSSYSSRSHSPITDAPLSEMDEAEIKSVMTQLLPKFKTNFSSIYRHPTDLNIAEATAALQPRKGETQESVEINEARVNELRKLVQEIPPFLRFFNTQKGIGARIKNLAEGNDFIYNQFPEFTQNSPNPLSANDNLDLMLRSGYNYEEWQRIFQIASSKSGQFPSESKTRTTIQRVEEKVRQRMKKFLDF